MFIGGAAVGIVSLEKMSGALGWEIGCTFINLNISVGMGGNILALFHFDGRIK